MKPGRDHILIGDLYSNCLCHPPEVSIIENVKMCYGDPIWNQKFN